MEGINMIFPVKTIFPWFSIVFAKSFSTSFNSFLVIFNGIHLPVLISGVILTPVRCHLACLPLTDGRRESGVWGRGACALLNHSSNLLWRQGVRVVLGDGNVWFSPCFHSRGLHTWGPQRQHWSPHEFAASRQVRGSPRRLPSLTWRWLSSAGSSRGLPSVYIHVHLSPPYHMVVHPSGLTLILLSLWRLVGEDFFSQSP